MRLIDADALIEIAYRIRLDSRERVVQMIESAPTVDPVKHGQWENTRSDAPMFGFYYCSECGRKRTSPQDKYCPNCGAKMEGEE